MSRGFDYGTMSLTCSNSSLPQRPQYLYLELIQMCPVNKQIIDFKIHIALALLPIYYYYKFLSVIIVYVDYRIFT